MTDRDRLPHILTARELEAWNLCEIRGMGQRKAALALGISRSALQSRIENARRKITLDRKEVA